MALQALATVHGPLAALASHNADGNGYGPTSTLMATLMKPIAARKGSAWRLWQEAPVTARIRHGPAAMLAHAFAEHQGVSDSPAAHRPQVGESGTTPCTRTGSAEGEGG